MKKEISFRLVSLIFVILVVCFAIAFYALGWVEPGESPPGVTVYAPLNVSAQNQVKEGWLTIGGTGDPLVPLDVQGTGAISAAGGAILNTSGAAPIGLIVTPTFAGDPPVMTGAGLIVDQGKVGIGTISPTQKLDIVGNLRIRGNYGIRIEDQTGWVWQFVSADDATALGVGVIWNSAGKRLYFANPEGGIVIKSKEVSLIMKKDTGNVGIGLVTMNPAAKLEVQGGAIKATDGLIIQTVASQADEDAMTKTTGQIWLRTDI